MKLRLALVVVLGSSAAAAADRTPPPPRAESAVIDSLCDAAKTFSQRRPGTARVFADTSDPTKPEAPPEWRELKNARELRDLLPEKPPYTQAFLWRTDLATFVSMTFSSPSGDWTHQVDYCFRGNGSLARSESELRTFNVADPAGLDEKLVARIRIKYFDPSGGVLGKRSRVLDLETRKPVKRSYMDVDEPIYKQLSELPFAALLK